MIEKAKHFAWPLLGSGLLVILVLLVINFVTDKSVVETTPAAEQTYALQGGKASLYVTGLVSASESAVISANSSGMITALPKLEGSFVNVGDMLIQQDSSVEDAQVAYRAADSERINIEQAAAADARAYAAKKAEMVAYSAEEIAQIRVAAGDDRTQEKAAQLQTSIESAVTASLRALAFVEDNRTLFDDNEREKFNAIVNDLYGLLPKQFQGSLGYSVGDSVQVLRVLEELRGYDLAEMPVVDTQTLSVVVMGQLRALTDLYAEAERDVLDPHQVTTGGDIYEGYFTERSGTLSALANLESAFANLDSTLATSQETVVTEDKNVAVTAIDRELADSQAMFATAIADAAQRAGAAAYQLAVAQQAQKSVSSPFSGVVGNVFKDVGVYVQAGEPVLTLVGQQGLEVEVTVPASLVDYIEVGTPFVNDGVVIGSVVRFSPVSVGHSHTVVVSLVEDGLKAGQAVSGHLEVVVESESVVVIPRTHVFFEHGGAVVRDQEGEEYPVSITYDMGSMLLITFLGNVSRPEGVVANRSVVL